MGGFATTSNHSQLAVGGNDIGHSPAWKIVDLTVLWSKQYRGTSVVLPGTAGRVPRERRVDEARYPLQMIVRGDFYVNGTAFSTIGASNWEGIQTNMQVLASYLDNPSGNTPSTWTWTPPSFGTPLATVGPYTAGCWVENLRFSSAQNAPVARAVFDLVNPSGVWA